MPSSQIRLFPDPILRQVSAPVQVFDSNLSKLIKRLVAVMKKQASGIGIAAPQIGVGQRVAVVDVSARIPAAERLILVNPVILEMAEPIGSREGCMSLPEYTADLKRYQWIRVRWQDEAGRFHEKATQGIEAICIQHEVDHLEGKLFIDRVISLKTDMLPRLLKRQ